MSDLAGERRRLEALLESQTEALGGEEHAPVAATLHELAGVLAAEGDLRGAGERLERSLEIQKRVLGSEEQPSVAASLHALAGVREAEGRVEEAIATYRRVLEIEEGVFGSLDQVHSAQTEVALGRILLERGEAEEGLRRVEHSAEVLEREASRHPALADARFMAATGLSVKVALLAKASLQTRAAGNATPEMLRAMREALDDFAEPHPVVGAFLGRLAAGESPELPPGLGEGTGEFLAGVAAAAESAVEVDVAGLAGEALETRRSGAGLSPRAAEELHMLTAAGPPHDAVAAALERVAAGEALEPPPAELPEDVREFLDSVRAEAAKIDAGNG